MSNDKSSKEKGEDDDAPIIALGLLLLPCSLCCVLTVEIEIVVESLSLAIFFQYRCFADFSSFFFSPFFFSLTCLYFSR